MRLVPTRPSTSTAFVAAYALFIGGLALLAMTLTRTAATMVVAGFPTMERAFPVVPSRVDQFLAARAFAEAHPARAHAPMLRQVRVTTGPDVPVAALATRLDEAESITRSRSEAASVIRMIRLAAAKDAKAAARKLKRARQIAASKPMAELALLDPMTGLMLKKTGLAKGKKVDRRIIRPLPETARDVTYRALGIITVAMN